MGIEYARGSKPVGSSHTVATRILRHEDMNGYGRLFGGRLMEWIDDLAGIAARLQCGGSITTVAIDKLEFRHPAFLNDIVVLVARMTYVGRSSCEVRVDSYIEDKEGFRRVINRAFLTFVAIDKNGKPVPIPYGLEVNSVSEKARWDGALLRRENRLSRKTIGF